LFVAGLFAAAPVAAETAPEQIELVYAAPSGCPDADAFFAGIHARANAVRADHGQRTFRVTITTDADTTVRGRLVVDGPDGSTTREVYGATCAETVSALALVAALAIEERATREAPRPSPTAIAPPHEPWHVAAGAGIGLYSGIAPTAAYGVPVFVAANYHRARFRLGFARTERVDAVVAAGTTDFRWTIGRVQACPFAFAIDRFEAAPCAGFEAGILDGRGTQVAMPASDTRPWLAPEAVLRLSVHLGPAALELEGLVAVPLVRDRFFIAPSTTVHQIPVLTTGASASLAIDLW
jgi:hypothetical protein